MRLKGIGIIKSEGIHVKKIQNIWIIIKTILCLFRIMTSRKTLTSFWKTT